MKIGLHFRINQTLFYSSLNNGLYISHSFTKAKILSSNFISLNQSLLNYYKTLKKKPFKKTYVSIQTELHNPFNIINS